MASSASWCLQPTTFFKYVSSTRSRADRKTTLTILLYSYMLYYNIELKKIKTEKKVSLFSSPRGRAAGTGSRVGVAREPASSLRACSRGRRWETRTAPSPLGHRPGIKGGREDLRDVIQGGGVA